MPLCVLVLDDDLRLVAAVEDELRRGGLDISCRQADTEAAYLEALQSQTDLVLASCGLPQFGPARALQVLHENGADIPLIVLCKSAEEAAAQSLLAQGALDYLLQDRLLRLPWAVRQALKQRQLRAERDDLAQELR